MSWKLTLPCTAEEARALAGEVEAFALMDAPPTLMTSEDANGGWRLEVYFETRPTKALIAQVRALVLSAGGMEPKPERLPDMDWVTLSQQGVEPIRAGRFFVHTPGCRGQAPRGTVALEIDAGLAFGTGQHDTTAGCLAALDRLKRQGAAVSNLADIGTGTGLLAFAAMHLWPAARAIASDIDATSIQVTRDNALVNGIPLGRGRGRLDTVAASGLAHPRLQARAPYDLVIANILAGPLIDMAPAIGGAVGPGGWLVLAGLLRSQQERVAAAYRRQGLRARFSIGQGDWPTLVMRKQRLPMPSRRGLPNRSLAGQSWQLTA